MFNRLFFKNYQMLKFINNASLDYPSPIKKTDCIKKLWLFSKSPYPEEEVSLEEEKIEDGEVAYYNGVVGTFSAGDLRKKEVSIDIESSCKELPESFFDSVRGEGDDKVCYASGNNYSANQIIHLSIPISTIEECKELLLDYQNPDFCHKLVQYDYSIECAE